MWLKFGLEFNPNLNHKPKPTLIPSAPPSYKMLGIYPHYLYVPTTFWKEVVQGGTGRFLWFASNVNGDMALVEFCDLHPCPVRWSTTNVADVPTTFKTVALPLPYRVGQKNDEVFLLIFRPKTNIFEYNFTDLKAIHFYM